MVELDRYLVDDPGFDHFLVHALGYGDTVVAIPHIVCLANLHKLDSWQGDVHPDSSEDTDPTRAATFLERVEIRIEICAASQAALDLADGY